MALVARARHELARHRWIARGVVIAAVVLAWWAATDWAGRVESERARWGTPVDVLVATADVAAGQPLTSAVEVRVHPRAVVPPTALASLDPGAMARRDVAAGTVLTDLDLAAPGGPTALVGRGELAVAVTERIPTGARVGDRVVVAADGVVVAPIARVVDATDDRVLLAVPTGVAPTVAAVASGPTGVALLLQP